MDSLYFLAVIAVLLAAIIQVLTGFGFALVSIPLLMYVYPGYDAVLICCVLSIFIFILQIRKRWRVARWDLIWRLTGIGLLGILTGVAVSEVLNAVHLKGIVGAAVLVYVIVQWVQIEKERRDSLRKVSASNESVSGLSDSSSVINEKLPKGFNFAGLISGLLIGVVGMPGPPIVAVLVQFLKKEVFLATLVIYFLINDLLVIFIAFTFFYRESIPVVLSASSVLIIPLFIGYLIGNPLRKFVNEQNFKRIVFGLLIIVGIISIFETTILL